MLSQKRSLLLCAGLLSCSGSSSTNSDVFVSDLHADLSTEDAHAPDAMMDVLVDVFADTPQDSLAPEVVASDVFDAPRQNGCFLHGASIEFCPEGELCRTADRNVCYCVSNDRYVCGSRAESTLEAGAPFCSTVVSSLYPGQVAALFCGRLCSPCTTTTTGLGLPCGSVLFPCVEPVAPAWSAVPPRSTCNDLPFSTQIPRQSTVTMAEDPSFGGTIVPGLYVLDEESFPAGTTIPTPISRLWLFQEDTIRATAMSLGPGTAPERGVWRWRTDGSQLHLEALCGATSMQVRYRAAARELTVFLPERRWNFLRIR